MNSNTPISVYVVSLFVALAIAGGYFFPRPLAPQIALSASPQGSTFGNSLSASVTMNLAGPTGTTTSILNTDSNDRLVTSSHLGCEGVGNSFTPGTGTGLANLTFSVGTTSTNFSSSIIAPNPFAKIAAYNAATNTVNMELSSSTLATATSSLAIVWPAGSYMTFWFNATNTAVCTAGVSYLGY
jgi:hypothetical protein